MNRKRQIIMWIVVLLMVVGVGTAVALQQNVDAAARGRTLEFDVAEDGTRFVFDTEYTFDDGLPAYGSTFVTQGYIYEAGTLDKSNGVLSDGSPEFPDKVIGEWTCRGVFVGDGAHSESGVWVITTQYYELGDRPGEVSLASEGVEVADVGQAVARAIIGGTGRYERASGTATQTLLGFNESMGVNLQFSLDISR